MKDFIKQRLNEALNENESLTTIIAYHGSPTKIKKFRNMFVGGKEAKDQEGPGIYFTTSESDAIGYAGGEGSGGYVYTVKLTFKNLLSNKVKSKNIDDEVKKLIKKAPNWRRIAMGYGDDEDEGLESMLYKYVDMSRNDKEVFVSVFMDVYKNDPVTFVKNMVKLGYDGIYLPSKDGGANIVIYNQDSIKIENTKQV